MINSFLKIPTSPGSWVDLHSCICGDTYKESHFQVTFQDGVSLVRQANQETNGGFRSRGPVLWAMRVLKAAKWYEKHMYCGETANETHSNNSR